MAGQHIGAARISIDHGGDVNIRQSNGLTPLYLATQAGYETIARLLLDNRADPNLNAKRGNTAIHRVVSKGHQAIT